MLLEELDLKHDDRDRLGHHAGGAKDADYFQGFKVSRTACSGVWKGLAHCVIPAGCLEGDADAVQEFRRGQVGHDHFDDPHFNPHRVDAVAFSLH